MPPADPPLPSPGHRALRESLRTGGNLRFAEGGTDLVIERRRAEELLDGLVESFGRRDFATVLRLTVMPWARNCAVTRGAP